MVQGRVETVDAKSNRTRESGMSDDEFRHHPGRDLTEIDFPIGLKGAAGAQDRHPLDGIDVAPDLLAAGKEDMVFDVEETRCAICSLEQFPDPDKIPAFAVSHRRVG